MLDRPATAPLSTATSSTVTIGEMGPRERLIFRAREQDAIARAGEAFGVPLPRQACRFAAASGRRAMWLGPDEWMLVTELGEAMSASPSVATGVAWVAACSLVDVSDRSLTIGVDGPKAAEVLASGCPLDLDERAFPVGMCTRTVFAKAEIILARTGPATFELDVWRSFAPYVREMLELAASEF